jgi:hypothetical protein
MACGCRVCVRGGVEECGGGDDRVGGPFQNDEAKVRANAQETTPITTSAVPSMSRACRALQRSSDLGVWSRTLAKGLVLHRTSAAFVKSARRGKPAKPFVKSLVYAKTHKASERCPAPCSLGVVWVRTGQGGMQASERGAWPLLFIVAAASSLAHHLNPPHTSHTPHSFAWPPGRHHQSHDDDRGGRGRSPGHGHRRAGGKSVQGSRRVSVGGRGRGEGGRKGQKQKGNAHP